ncbi:hypothetical protein PRIPAC_86532, partial [Pristionchus pacificus]|uniref:Uncharacterized protein n=1 Tax=Pristionchus pacificus TaxID=54126 RepID=A0A2A6BSG0_PRIPA
VPYETVCEKIEQWPAHAKNFDYPKSCDLGFSRVLMTIGIFIFHAKPPLGPDDGYRSKSDFDVTSSGANGGIDIFELCQTQTDLIDSLANGLILRVLMTVGILDLVVEPPLAPDDVTSESVFLIFSDILSDIF